LDSTKKIQSSLPNEPLFLRSHTTPPVTQGGVYQSNDPQTDTPPDVNNRAETIPMNREEAKEISTITISLPDDMTGSTPEDIVQSLPLMGNEGMNLNETLGIDENESFTDNVYKHD
jgi:hypothetical protein